MRKWVVLACCLVVGAAGVAAGQVPGIEYQDGWVPGERPVETMLTGDVSGDGVVSIADVVALVEIADGLIEPESWQVMVGDLDGDGVITRDDAAILLAQVDPMGQRFAIRFFIGEGIDGEIQILGNDILSELRTGEVRALHTGDMSPYFDLVSQGCSNCNQGNCSLGFDRTTFARLSVKSDLDGEICSATPTVTGLGNATFSFWSTTTPQFPLKANDGVAPGTPIIYNMHVTLTTCSNFATYFTLNGLHCRLSESLECNSDNTACVSIP